MDQNDKAWRPIEDQFLHDLNQPSSVVQIPILEEYAQSANPVVAGRAKRILRNLLARIIRTNRRQFGYMSVLDGPLLGVLGDVSWQLVRDVEAGRTYDIMRGKAAMYQPLPLYVDLTKPTDQQRADFLRRINHDDYTVRMRAIRSIGPTSDQPLLHAVVGRFQDPYNFTINGECMPMSTHPVADVASRLLRYHGPAAEQALLTAARNKNPKVRWHADRLLPKLGPSPAIIAHYQGLLVSTVPHIRNNGVIHLGHLGPKAVPALIPIAAAENEDVGLRCRTINAIVKAGGSPKAIELLNKLKTHPNKQLRDRATYALKKLNKP